MRKLFLITLAFGLLFCSTLFAYELPFDAGNIDFGGATVTYVGFYDPRESFMEGGDYPGRLAEAMEKFNIGDIQYLGLPWEGIAEHMMNRLLSDESKYDIWLLPSNAVMGLIAKNALYPISEIVPASYYDSLLYSQKVVTETFVKKGEKYALGAGTSPIGVLEFVVWNKDIFSREGLPPLDELYLSGEWTYDKMEEIAIRATRDTDGDGELDQWGIGQQDIAVWGFSNGANPTIIDENGRHVFAYNNEAATYYLGKLRQWSQVMNISKGDWQQKEFLAGQVAMASFPLWNIIDPSFTDVVEFNYGIVPLPKGPHVDDYQFPARQADSFYLPVNSANPMGLVALHRYLFRAEEEEEGIEEMLIQAAMDEISYEVLLRAAEEWSGEVYIMEGILGPTWDTSYPLGGAIGKALYEGQSPAAAMEEVAPVIQQTLDREFNN